MKLLIVLVTYNRLSYSKRTLRALWDTLEVPYYLVVVDNNSSDGTQKYMESLVKRGKIDKFIANPDNYYPGRATNIGWEEGLKDYPQATHLARIDNDMAFDKGWNQYAEQYFETIPLLGQLGLDYDGGEGRSPTFYEGMGLIHWPGSVGGPNIIRKQIWDDGIRYDETVWDGSGSPVQEDSMFSTKIKNDGWLVGHMDRRLSYTFATKDNWHEHKDYYIKTMKDRGYTQNVEYLESLDD